MHTSYFLFVMVITMFCYAVIKGRPSKLRQNSPEFCSEKVSSGGVRPRIWLWSVCRPSQLFLIDLPVGGSFPPEKLVLVFLLEVVYPQPKLWCWVFNHISKP